MRIIISLHESHIIFWLPYHKRNTRYLPISIRKTSKASLFKRPKPHNTPPKKEGVMNKMKRGVMKKSLVIVYLIFEKGFLNRRTYNINIWKQYKCYAYYNKWYGEWCFKQRSNSTPAEKIASAISRNICYFFDTTENRNVATLSPALSSKVCSPRVLACGNVI